MDWNTIWTVVGIGVGVVTLVYAFLRNMKIDINSHIDRIDRHMESVTKRLESHAQRIDVSYKMFVDLLKERRDP